MIKFPGPSVFRVELNVQYHYLQICLELAGAYVDKQNLYLKFLSFNSTFPRTFWSSQFWGRDGTHPKHITSSCFRPRWDLLYHIWLSLYHSVQLQVNFTPKWFPTSLRSKLLLGYNRWWPKRNLTRDFNKEKLTLNWMSGVTAPKGATSVILQRFPNLTNFGGSCTLWAFLPLSHHPSLLFLPQSQSPQSLLV